MSTNSTVWGIRSGGHYFDASGLFTQQEYIGVGWSDVGYLNNLPADVRSIKAHLMRTHAKYSDITPRRFAHGASTLYNLRYVMQNGDIVVYRHAAEDAVYVGRVVGPYRFAPHIHPNAPHMRKVQWQHQKASISGSACKQLFVRGLTLWRISKPLEFLQLAGGSRALDTGASTGSA